MFQHTFHIKEHEFLAEIIGNNEFAGEKILRVLNCLQNYRITFALVCFARLAAIGSYWC
jgi:hypothetical protein